MKHHESTRLAQEEGFGSVSHTSCGVFHVHMPGVSVHLKEREFLRLCDMMARAARAHRDGGAASTPLLTLIAGGQASLVKGV
ncbi:MAG: hypothetical protein ACLFOY_13325 [Desulfatibacillaceae bacterium]